MSDDPIRRGNRWQAFYEEEGGIRDMLATIRAAYFERMSALEPWQVAQLSNLAIAAKVVTQLDAAVMDIVAQGKIADAARRTAEAHEAIPDHKRRWA